MNGWFWNRLVFEQKFSSAREMYHQRNLVLGPARSGLIPHPVMGYSHKVGAKCLFLLSLSLGVNGPLRLKCLCVSFHFWESKQKGYKLGNIGSSITTHKYMYPDLWFVRSLNAKDSIHNVWKKFKDISKYKSSKLVLKRKADSHVIPNNLIWL